jgi:Spy/CpxP family protein refolding chaperone
MKNLFKPLVIASLLAGLAGMTGAQTPPPGTPGGPGMREQGQRMDPAARQDRMARHHARMQQHMAKRQAELKQKLQITPAQEGAWSTWTAAMQPPARMQRPDRAEFEKLTTPERIDRMRAMRSERMAAMDKRADATKTFYAALTPEQKKVFDAETARRGHRGHGGRHGEHRRG